MLTRVQNVAGAVVVRVCVLYIILYGTVENQGRRIFRFKKKRKKHVFFFRSYYGLKAISVSGGELG